MARRAVARRRPPARVSRPLIRERVPRPPARVPGVRAPARVPVPRPPARVPGVRARARARVPRPPARVRALAPVAVPRPRAPALARAPVARALPRSRPGPAPRRWRLRPAPRLVAAAAGCLRWWRLRPARSAGAAAAGSSAGAAAAGCSAGGGCGRLLRWGGCGRLLGGAAAARRGCGRLRGGGRGWLLRLGCGSLLAGAGLCLQALCLGGLLPRALLRFLTGALRGLLTGPLLGLLALALEPRALLLLAEDVVALGDHVSDRLGDQRARADRVVVARHHVVDPVRIAVGVDEADDRDAQALGLAHGDGLGLQVDHEHRVGHALHVLDATEVGPQLLQVGLRRHSLPGGKQLKLALGLIALEVVQTLDAQRDRLEVRQQAAQPAMVDIGHVGGLGVLLDRVARLLLGADEQHGPATPRHLGGELAGILQQGLRLQEVDDVVPIALAEDEAAHLGIPATGLVAEVDAGLQQLLDTDLSHGLLPWVGVLTARSGALVDLV